MANEYILKTELLSRLALQKSKWREIKGKVNVEQDVTHENFIDDVILTLDWVINDIENM